MPPSLILTLPLVCCLTACASLDRALANRLACTADGKRAVVASMYGPIGVASFVADDDAQAVCQVQRQPASQPTKSTQP